MIFNSIKFLIFFPITTLIYFIFPKKFKYIWLLISSYYFYMCWNPKYIIILFTSTLITYVTAILISKFNKLQELNKKILYKKLSVIICIVLNLCILGYFKYTNFFAANLNYILEIFKVKFIIPRFDIIMPIGISFYTFQSLGYIIDVYREDIETENNFAKYALFVSFFPQIASGPIGRAKNLLPQINIPNKFNYETMKNGLLLMIWGFFLKLVLADRIAILVNQIYDNYMDYAGFEILIATVLFAIQLYCDFDGYSSISIGAAQVMGFKLMNNFEQPYFAKSVREFWKRWHISLSSWLKDYLYIPLGGSRCSKLKKYRNIMITFLISGLWHGSSWNYIIWGFLHGFYQVLGDSTKSFREKFKTTFKIKTNCFSYKLFQILYTFILVDFAWLFFRAPSALNALKIIKQMFLEFNPWILFDGTLYTYGLDQKDFRLMIYSIIILFVVDLLKSKIKIREKVSKQNIVFRWSLYFIAIFSVLIFGIYGPGYDASQFIYFQY